MVRVLIAADHADARAWCERHGFRWAHLVVVTPRSPHAARGFTADAIYATDAGRAHKAFGAMLDDAFPALLGAPTPVVTRAATQ